MPDLLDQLRQAPPQGPFGAFTGNRAEGVRHFDGYDDLAAVDQVLLNDVRENRRPAALLCHAGTLLLFEYQAAGDAWEGQRFGYTLRRLVVRPPAVAVPPAAAPASPAPTRAVDPAAAPAVPGGPSGASVVVIVLLALCGLGGYLGWVQLRDNAQSALGRLDQVLAHTSNIPEPEPPGSSPTDRQLAQLRKDQDSLKKQLAEADERAEKRARWLEAKLDTDTDAVKQKIGVVEAQTRKIDTLKPFVVLPAADRKAIKELVAGRVRMYPDKNREDAFSLSEKQLNEDLLARLDTLLDSLAGPR